MNWKRFIFKIVAMIIMCISLDAINIGIGQIAVNYMATYQMNNTVDSTFWIQLVPILGNLGTLLMIVVLCFVFKNEFQYMWNYGKKKENKENEKI